MLRSEKQILPARLDYKSIAERLERVARFECARAPKIAVVGDFCLDKYLYLYPALDEKSVETGKTAYQVRAKRLFAGVGGTIANNLRALGAETYCFGVVGEDGEGFDLLRALKKVGANVDGIVVSDEILTGAYVKPMRPETTSGEPFPAPNSGVWIEGDRYDTRNPTPVPTKLIDALKQKFLAQITQFDAVIVSDQFPNGSEAIFSREFRNFLADVADANPDLFFMCDSRFFVDEYRNALVKCNANELFDAYRANVAGGVRKETTLDVDAESKTREICVAGEWLARRNGRPALITRGAQGSILVEVEDDEARFVAVPANPVEPPIDICGAGDATNAGLAFAKSLGFSLVESAYLAGVVSSITIKQIGVTGVASVAQILEILHKRA